MSYAIRKRWGGRTRVCRAAYIALLAASLPTTAANLDIGSTLLVEGIHQQQRTPAGTDDLNTLRLEPSITANYNSAHSEVFGTFSHSYLQRQNDRTDTRNNFSSGSIQGEIEAIDNLLFFTADYAQQYQAGNVGNQLIADILTDSEELTRTSNSSVGTRLTLERGDYLRFRATFSEQRTRTDQDTDPLGGNGLDSTNQVASMLAYNGDETGRIRYSLQVSEQRSERATRGDFNSALYDALVSIQVFGDFGVAFTGYRERNSIPGLANQPGNFRQLSQAGIGLNYQPSDNRVLRLSAERTLTDNQATINADGEQRQDSDDQTNLAIELDWAFSPRTRLTAAQRVRFFGDAQELSISHVQRSLRTQLSYSERLTTQSRLANQRVDQGVFVCTDGVFDISRCVQPDTVDVELDSNQQLVQFNGIESELVDQVFINRNLNLNLGLARKRYQLALNVGRSEREFLETNRVTVFNSLGLSASRRLSRASTLVGDVRFLETQAKQQSIVDGGNQSTRASLTVDRQLNRQANLVVSLIYLDLSPIDQQTPLLGQQELEEVRATLGLRWQLSR